MMSLGDDVCFVPTLQKNVWNDLWCCIRDTDGHAAEGHLSVAWRLAADRASERDSAQRFHSDLSPRGLEPQWREEVEGGIEGGLSHFKLRAIHLLFAFPSVLLFHFPPLLMFCRHLELEEWCMGKCGIEKRWHIRCATAKKKIWTSFFSLCFSVTNLNWHSLDQQNTVRQRPRSGYGFPVPAGDPYQKSVVQGLWGFWVSGAVWIPHGQSGWITATFEGG